MSITEAYMPDRVARQFGRVQGIPSATIPTLRDTSLSGNLRLYKKLYSDYDACWEHMVQHNYAPKDLGPHAHVAHSTTADYMEWYIQRSHIQVHNPAHGPRIRPPAWRQTVLSNTYVPNTTIIL